MDEFRAEHGIAEPFEKIDSTCVRWRRTGDAPIGGGADAPLRDGPVGAPRPVARPQKTHVPTAREVELEPRLTVLHGRLEAAEAEVARLAGAPWRGPRAWLQQKVHGARR